MATPVKRINLALQGGGAHGAYTWGVLDRLLEDERIEIAAISGTSAGALNAVTVKAGMCDGGREGARALLDHVWGQIGAVTDERLTGWMSLMAPFAPWLAMGMEYSPAITALNTASRLMTPYAYGPALKNPLGRIVQDLVGDGITGDAGPQIHVCATNVRSGKIRVFSGSEVTGDAVLASACLPTLFRAVEIDDRRCCRTLA